ncbi:hypothetical protein GZL_01181 [Streptomyces sp. 769]|nr:hypothetical protein GZL_01181 [Streptomyces sp. 769]
MTSAPPPKDGDHTPGRRTVLRVPVPRHRTARRTRPPRPLRAEPCHGRPGCLVPGDEESFGNPKGAGHASVHGRRGRGRGTATGDMRWAGDGHHNERGRAGGGGHDGPHGPHGPDGRDGRDGRDGSGGVGSVRRRPRPGRTRGRTGRPRCLGPRRLGARHPGRADPGDPGGPQPRQARPRGPGGGRLGGPPRGERGDERVVPLP